MRIGLLGSGEFTEVMVEVDKYILQDVHDPVVAILPTAAGKEEDWWKWVEMGKRHFNQLAVESIGIDVRSKSEANDEKRMQELKRANVVYISGGDPGYLVQSIKDTLVWEEIQKKELVVGSSAGAMLLGQWVLGNIYPVFEHGEKKLEWVKATGLVPYTIWPHYDYVQREEREKWEWLKGHMPDEIKSSSIGIDENTAWIMEGGKEMVMGSGKVRRDIRA